MEHRIAIIVAGGRGLRMNNPLPKQFQLLDGIPVLMRTIHAFSRLASQPDIVVCLPEDQQEYWLELCYKYSFHVPHHISNGGETRFQTVSNALEFIKTQEKWANQLSEAPEHTLIAVHDGVRPLVSLALIELGYRQAAIHHVAVPGLPSTESVRILEKNRENSSIERDRVILIQTPQVFRADILLNAYQQVEQVDSKDDASVVEISGFPITIFEGESTNIKITHSQDLNIAMMHLKTDKS